MGYFLSFIKIHKYSAITTTKHRAIYTVLTSIAQNKFMSRSNNVKQREPVMTIMDKLAEEKLRYFPFKRSTILSTKY